MTHFDNDRNDPIIDHLDTVQSITGYGYKRIFGDWVNTMADSFAKDDVAYTKRVDDYKSEYPDDTDEIFEQYQKAYVALSTISRENEIDVLGEVYEQLGATSDSFGQFFTPNGVAEMMTKIIGTTGTREREATIDDPLSVKDGTCGSGRLLIHQAYHMMEVQPNEPTIFVGQDIDRLCARMTAVNFAVHGIAGYAIHGDSLKMERQNIWKIQHANLENGIIEEIDPEGSPSENQDSNNMERQAEPIDGNNTSGDDFVETNEHNNLKGNSSGGSSEEQSETVTLTDFE